MCRFRTVDSTATDGDSSSFTHISSVDTSVSADSITSPRSTASVNHITSPCSTASVNHTVTRHSPDATDKLIGDGLHVIAENPNVPAASDDGRGDSVLEVCNSWKAEMEVKSLCVEDEQADVAGQYSVDETAAADEMKAVELNDVDNDAVIISASSSLSSFTITPSSSVAVDDLSPYPVAVSLASQLASCTESSSYIQDAILTTSSNTCSVRSCEATDGTLVGLKADDRSAIRRSVMYALKALNLPLLSTESASSDLQCRRYSAPTVVDGQNSGECEEAVRSDSSLDSITNSKDVHPGVDNGRQLQEAAEVTEGNYISTVPSHAPPVSAVASDFDRESFPTSGVTSVAVDNDRQLCNIVEDQSVDYSHISSAPVSNCPSLLISGDSEAAVVDDNSLSDKSCDGDEVHPTHHSPSTFRVSAVQNTDVTTPACVHTVPSTDQCIVNSSDNISTAKSKHGVIEVTDGRNGTKLEKAADARRPNVDDLVALKQVKHPCFLSDSIT